MRKWFSNLGYKISGFMQGRYGYDELSRFLSIAGIIIMFVSCIPYLHLLYFPGLAMLVWSWYRIFSRNIYKRQMERSRYLDIRDKTVQKFRMRKSMWRDRKTHKYYKCPGCKTFVRITKPGKGKRIMVTCPKCRRSFEKRT
jgi:hypothetical protein